MITKFWSTLFEPEEYTCFAHSVQGTRLYRARSIFTQGEQFFSINPLKDSRADANVTSFRNILVEFDKLPLTEQVKFSHSIPFSTLTFSGNKSYHYIISLKEPCEDIAEYKKLVKRIQVKLPDMDTSTSNPSRLSRTPGAIRGNGEEQKLILVNRRISRFDLDLWLGPELKTEEPRNIIMPLGADNKRMLPLRTRIFIKEGANEGGRNQALFINACELFRANYSKEEIFDIAMRVLDLPITEIRQCIASAEKAVAQE